MIYLLVLSLSFVPMFAKPSKIDVVEIIKESYTKDVSVKKSRIMLTSKEKETLRQMAKFPVKSKLYRYYKVEKDERILGYGLLINQKVRTKKATILYFIEDGKVKFIEILAFLEPREYIPRDTWMGQFNNKNITDVFKVGKDIPTISGATMSARVIADGARLAVGLYRLKLK